MVEETRGNMNIRMQVDMWHSFNRLVKWTIIVAAVVLGLMAIFLV